MHLSIRTIRKSDNTALARIVRDVLTEFHANKPGTVYFDPTTDNLYDLFRHERSAYFVAEADGTIAGGAGFYPTEGLPADTCELVKMYLIPAVRGSGLGRTLLEKCFQGAKSAGFSKMYLETLPELSRALHVYEKAGFTYLENPLGNSGHFGCDRWMIKTLE
jgi:putative acetyltransferase